MRQTLAKQRMARQIHPNIATERVASSSIIDPRPTTGLEILCSRAVLSDAIFILPNLMSNSGPGWRETRVQPGRRRHSAAFWPAGLL
jgi:hypothetical protein